ncbi:DNA cytosine methyltransferase [Streptomyces sp. NRRL F-4707]|uniref:DNA cytosine methyltransferase n=1 Tax=Streptomyces sp. NRRL F-4707 TaxID=1519496 RepID=UPI000AB24445|nr:DNA cytosine methyltransferase [Streptomyces sp. NRRL F-4707]
MSPLRIGSLFTGTGALDLAVMDVYDADVVWHSQYEPPDKNGKEDKNQYAAKILARHWPDVPNLGDITKIDWQGVLDEHGPVDILTGGFPCQDVSSAGRRVGLNPDSRSGLWNHMAHAISILQPKLVVIENVEGLLSAPAASDMEPCPYCVGDGHAEPVLRACGAVLGDLASLGFDAEWGRYGADEVGAPHRRRRIIIRAWPAALDPGRLGRGDGPRIVGGLGTAGRDTEASADTANLGHERDRAARDGRPGPADGDLAAADAGGPGLEVGGVEPDGPQLPTAERGRGEPAADSDSVESERRGVAGVMGGQAAAEPGEGDQRERAGHTARDSREADADAEGDGRHEGRPQSARQQGRPDAAQPCGAAPSDADRVGCRTDVLDLRPEEPDLDWGDYEPAIRRWERVLGRRAPWPTDALGRLSPVFTEWLMGLPDGWVTDTPGLTRPAMLRALGNGVVWQQAAYALRDLHRRALTYSTEAAA